MEEEYINGEYNVDIMNTNPTHAKCDECDSDRRRRCYSCNNSWTQNNPSPSPWESAGKCKWCNVLDVESLLNEMDGLQ